MKISSAIWACPLLLIHATSSAQPLSFQNAWQLLQTNNHALAAQQSNVDRYNHLSEGKSALNLPKITLNANYTHLDQDITLSGEQLADSINLPALPGAFSALGSISSTLLDQDIFSTSIRAIWPVFTGGKISAAQYAAEGKKEEAQAQFALETQAKYEDLSKYYFSVLLAQEVVKTRSSVELGLSKHRNNAIKLEEQGQIPHVEKLQADASFDKAKVERRKAERDLQIAQTALTQILNQASLVIPTDPLFINKTLPPLEKYIDKTLTSYPGLSILQAKSKQVNSLIDAEKSKYYPDVFLYGDYSIYEGDSLMEELKPDWLVGIGVSIPILDTSGRSDSIKAAHSANYQIQHLTAQAKLDLQLLVKKTYLEAEQAIEEVTGLNSSLALAKENVRLREKAFSQGISNTLDVVDAQLYLSSIETQQSVAKFHYLLALTKLLALSSEMHSFHQYQYLNNSASFSTQKG